MSDAPKLFTEAEARIRFDHELTVELRERGLIAPAPVDALLIEAREICAKHFESHDLFSAAADYRSGKNDDEIDRMDHEMSIALAALRRGMELAKPELTREMVREAVAAAHLTHRLKDEADAAVLGFRINRLHAALTEGQSK